MREVKHKFTRHAGGNAKYDWDTILNGKTWELKQGEDFTMEPRTFVAHCHGTAKRRNLKVRTHTDIAAKSVVIRAYKEKAKDREVVLDELGVDVLAN
tara:strand:+ start:88 stop:378 length:291 start_codon:yes stop_codon:yes gene_type:complete